MIQQLKHGRRLNHCHKFLEDNMDEQLQAKIDEAKAAGYSDEEIQHYLNTKEIPVEQPIDRSAEMLGTVNATAPSALTLGAEGLALGYAGKKAVEAFQNRGPVAPAQAQAPAVQPQVQAQVNGRPNLTVQPGGAGATAGQQAFSQMEQQLTKPPQLTAAQSIVQKLALDKVLKGAGIAAGAYELGKGLFYTSPEEIATMKEAEARKRAQGWKPLNER